MTIALYSASQKDGNRIFNFIKSIEINFIPNVGYNYFDEENKTVYSITTICFAEEKISAVVSKLDETRVEPFSMLFSN
jgi:hypothetical protein